jgi:carboxyl-terminal processing protease
MKIVRFTLMTFLVLTFGAGLFGAGFLAGQATAHNGFIAEASTQANTPPALGDKFAPFWEAWTLVHEEYVDQPVDDQKLAYGAIKGMLSALGDRHTGYSTPAESEVLFSDAAGELEGIGAEVDTSGEYLKVVSPLPGSPAEQAGILPGDTIIKVDGEDIGGQDGFTVISKVRGPAGSTVRLTILRIDEPDPLEFTITRAKITIPSVESKVLAGNVAYVKINNFGDKTTSELKIQLEAVLLQNPAGLVLDLRGNPGGYRDAAIDVISQFVADGAAMIQRDGDGREQVFEIKPGGLATGIPMVVLINQGSASASEIVAGAIQDYERGKVIGEQSYGKGTVQDWRPLSNSQGSVRITIARWLTPEGRSIDKQGITPDLEVNLTKEDRQANRDPQLDAAIRELTGG